MTTTKFEEFVQSICKPRGIVPTREEWARMHALRADHVRFAIVLARVGKKRYVQIVPERQDRHGYARALNVQLRLGNAVLYVCYQKNSYIRVCSCATWADDYRAIVPLTARPRSAKVANYRKVKVSPQSDTILPRNIYQPTDYPEPKSENPYRRRCPNHGFKRTDRANRVMNWMGNVTVRV